MERWKKFMLESNRIEGEDRLNPNDEEAYDFAVAGIDTEEDILILHKLLTGHLNVDWSGEYRTCNVKVGNYTPPTFYEVKEQMEIYIKALQTYNSWKAHNEFERIHPFRDFNGRTGRLIWLGKTHYVDYEIPFLQKYYYQTLYEYEKEKK